MEYSGIKGDWVSPAVLIIVLVTKLTSNYLLNEWMSEWVNKIMIGMWGRECKPTLGWSEVGRATGQITLASAPSGAPGVWVIVGSGVRAHLPQWFYTSKGSKLCTKNLTERGKFIKNKQICLWRKVDFLQLIGNQAMGERLWGRIIKVLYCFLCPSFCFAVPSPLLTRKTKPMDLTAINPNVQGARLVGISARPTIGYLSELGKGTYLHEP